MHTHEHTYILRRLHTRFSTRMYRKFVRLPFCFILFMCCLCLARVVAPTTGEHGVISCRQNVRHQRHQEAGLLGDGRRPVVAGVLLDISVSEFVCSA